MPLWFAHPPPTTNHQPPATMPSFLLPLAALVSAGAAAADDSVTGLAATIGWEKVVHQVEMADPVFPSCAANLQRGSVQGSPRFSRRIRGVVRYPRLQRQTVPACRGDHGLGPAGLLQADRVFAGQAAHQEGPSAVHGRRLRQARADFEGSPVDSEELVAQVPARAAGRGWRRERRGRRHRSDAARGPRGGGPGRRVHDLGPVALGQRRNGPARAASYGTVRDRGVSQGAARLQSPPRC